jgi:hypothetical protein
MNIREFFAFQTCLSSSREEDISSEEKEIFILAILLCYFFDFWRSHEDLIPSSSMIAREVACCRFHFFPKARAMIRSTPI